MPHQYSVSHVASRAASWRTDHAPDLWVITRMRNYAAGIHLFAVLRKPFMQAPADGDNRRSSSAENEGNINVSENLRIYLGSYSDSRSMRSSKYTYAECPHLKDTKPCLARLHTSASQLSPVACVACAARCSSIQNPHHSMMRPTGICADVGQSNRMEGKAIELSTVSRRTPQDCCTRGVVVPVKMLGSADPTASEGVGWYILPTRTANIGTRQTGVRSQPHTTL